MVWHDEPEDRFSDIAFEEEANASECNLGNSWKSDEDYGDCTDLHGYDDGSIDADIPPLVERDYDNSSSADSTIRSTRHDKASADSMLSLTSRYDNSTAESSDQETRSRKSSKAKKLRRQKQHGQVIRLRIDKFLR